MNGIPIEVEKLMRKQSGNSERVANLVYTFMTHFHQSYSEVMKIPIPLAIQLLKRLEKENKEITRRNRNGK